MTSPTSRVPILVTAAVLLLPGLTGCGDQSEQYCDRLEGEAQALKDLAENAGAADEDYLKQSLEIFQGLREEAPEDVVDEWDTLVFAVEGLDEALDEAGISAAEFVPGQRPEGVSEDQMQAVENAAEELRSQPVLDAGEGLEQHARDVCDIDLTLTG